MEVFNDLKSKVVLITGGYGYLGSSMAKSILHYGAKVYVAGKSEEKFIDSFKDFRNAQFLEMDVSSVSSIENAIARIEESYIDVLINNAYFGKTNHPEKMNEEEWLAGMDGGVNQYFNVLRLSLPKLKKSKGAKVINVSSMYGVTVPDLDVYSGREEFLNPPNYGVSKAAVIHLTKYYAMCLGKYGINVNAISPGPFPSNEVQKDQEFVRRLEKKTKLNRIGRPKDLNGVILLLSSNASDYITGVNIPVDGGWTI